MKDALSLVRETDLTYRVERGDQTVVAVIRFIGGPDVAPPQPAEVQQVLLPWRPRRPNPVAVGAVRLRLGADPEAQRLRAQATELLADARTTGAGGLILNQTQARLLTRLLTTEGENS